LNNMWKVFRKIQLCWIPWRTNRYWMPMAKTFYVLMILLTSIILETTS
jgi:hypothetical protein